MASTPQPQIVGSPPAGELVSKTVLWMTGLNAQAFSGQLNPSNLYRQLVDGGPSVFPLLREVEEKDLAVGSALATRRLLVLAREADVHVADQENRQAQLYADELAAFLDSIKKWRWVLWELLDAPAYGYSVMEIIWKLTPEGIRTEKIIGRPQELFRFGLLTEPQTGELMLSEFPGGQPQPVPANKFLVNTYQSRHGDQRGLPLIRRLFWPSWFKRNALRLHLQFLEKGSGTIVVQYNPGASETEKDKALEAARAIAEEIACAVPQGFTLLEAPLQGTRTRQGDDYDRLFQYFDAEMTRIVLGQTLTTRGSEQQRGTQALGNVHEQLLLEVIRSDAADLEETINEQLCAPWLTWTFGPQALERAVRPWWTIEKDPPEDVSESLRQLAQARNLGLKIAQSEAYELSQLRTPEEGEPVLEPPAAPNELFQPGE